MLANKRQELIIQNAKQFGQITVQELSEKLSVSTETIRRDINKLDKLGTLKKVHGGAVYINTNRFEGTYLQRQNFNLKEKEEIAKIAVGFIKENDTIAIDTGATTDWICYLLPNISGITIITSSISALIILKDRIAKGEINPKIIFLGGEVNTNNNYTCGPMTLDLLKSFFVDKAFISCTAISENGVMMHDLYDSSFTKTLIKHSHTNFMLATNDKFEKSSLHKFCELTELDYIISDSNCNISASFKNFIKNNEIKLIF